MYNVRYSVIFFYLIKILIDNLYIKMLGLPKKKYLATQPSCVYAICIFQKFIH